MTTSILPDIPFGPAFIDAYWEHYIAWGQQCFEAGCKSHAASGPVGHVYSMEALVPGGKRVVHAALRRDLPDGAVLYSTPQASEQESQQ